MVRLAVKMMLWLASASLAGRAVRAAPAACDRPASGAGAAARPALPRAPVAPDEFAALPEQLASSRAAPDISAAQMSAVKRAVVSLSPRGTFEAPPSLLARCSLVSPGGAVPLGSRSAVPRSGKGPRGARAGAVVFMPLGRAPPGARFRRPGHVLITDCPPWTHGPGSRAGLAE